MNRITLHPPEPGPHAVSFRWEVDPPTALYRRSGFTLRFPDSLDLSRVPPCVWWWTALSCVHSHWAFLRPCRVRLPITLRPGEAEFWSRLHDAEVTTLEAYRGSADVQRQIEIVEAGPSLGPVEPLPDTGRCATAFSGGKDSLLQTGLLTELTTRPILVTTTSPMRPLEDHITSRRRHILREVVARRDVTLVEVESDYRASWENGFPSTLGYPVSVNEVTDTFLYFAALLVAGVALSATHLFLASETEVQETVELEGRTVQHQHFMYSAVTQQALQALLAPLGIRYGSLTSPLHSFQIQHLLWTRYADLRDLQYSCWRVRAEEATCSRCSQCLRIAFSALALGDTPARIGVDLVTLLNAMRDWSPKPLPDDRGPVLPGHVVSSRLDAQAARNILATPPGHVLKVIARAQPDQLLTHRGWRALWTYGRLRRRAAAAPIDAPSGYRPGFLRFFDPLLRQPVGAIFAEHFHPEDEASHADLVARSGALSRWIVQPIARPEETGSAPSRFVPAGPHWSSLGDLAP